MSKFAGIVVLAAVLSRSKFCFLILLLGMLWVVLPTSAFANTASGCSNQPGSPTDVAGTLYTQFTCTLYNDASTYTINLTPFMTQGGANLSDNLVGAGYVVLMNCDPLTVSNNDNNDAALYNESLWVAVLYWPGDQDAGTASDALTVYWQGAFPSATVVQNFDENLYGPGYDSEFFVQSTGSETVYTPGANEYDVIATPLPAALPLFATGLGALGLLGWRRKRKNSAALAAA
jgi:hypothetical protein